MRSKSASRSRVARSGAVSYQLAVAGVQRAPGGQRVDAFAEDLRQLHARRQRPRGPARPQRGFADGFPELGEALDTMLRRVAGDDCRVQCADGDAGDPVRMQARLGHRLVDTGLVGAERAAALQDQGGDLVGILCGMTRSVGLVRSLVCGHGSGSYAFSAR